MHAAAESLRPMTLSPDFNSVEESPWSPTIIRAARICSPASVPANGHLDVSIRFQVAGNRAVVMINDGPEVPLKTPSVLGLSYIGLAVSAGGVIGVRDIKTRLN